MQKQKTREGDTSRTSSQGRKLSSGDSKSNDKGNPEINENTKNPVKETGKKKTIPGKKK